MKVLIASDHAGFELKKNLIQYFESKYKVVDLGTNSTKPVDYPDYAEKLGHSVLSEKGCRGVLICGSGVGASVAANKIHGIRASVCHDTYSAHQGVEHDDMNVIVLGSRIIGVNLAIELVENFLKAKFQKSEVRFVRRLNKILALEENFK
jgi:ribose 5-phosphate isomerase B